MKKRRDASASVSGSHSASQSTVASADKSSVELAGNGAGDPAGQSTNAATWRPRAGNRPLLIVAIICYATILAFLLSRSLAL